MNTDSLIEKLSRLKTGTNTIFNGDQMIDCCIDVVRLHIATGDDEKQSREIPALDEDFKKHASEKALDIIASFYNILAARDAEIARLREPMSLQDATNSLHEAARQRAQFSDCKVNDTKEFSRILAKAVLDAAGVKYVD